MKPVLLAAALAGIAFAQTAILQIKVVEGEGSVYAPGSRVGKPLAVLVTDETGGPVAGAAVSFHLPEAGPGGTFANRLRTDVASTDSSGRATIKSLQLNRITGPFQIRIVAIRDQGRAGAVSNQYISEAKGSGTSTASSGSWFHRKWVYIALAGAGVAAAGVVGRGALNRSASASPSTPPVTIGAPTITIGGGR